LTGSIEAVEDGDSVVGAQVQIVSVAKDSPAMAAGLEVGDIVESIKIAGAETPMAIDKVGQIQEIAKENGGVQLDFKIKRGAQESQVVLTPRQNPPAGEGAMGVGLLRVAPIKYSFWQAAENGFTATWNMTLAVFDGWGQIIGRLAKNEGLPAGAQMVGPVGIMQMMAQRAQMGINYYLQFTAMISVYLAVFNALPIPALDGGRLMFLAIEAVFRKPVPEKIEQRLTIFFFMALMLFAIIVTVQDVMRLF
jgi:regulator of sigma E protease